MKDEEAPMMFGVGPPLSDKCAPGRDRHCMNHHAKVKHLVLVEGGTHECLQCCWCGWKVCRTTHSAKNAAAHGPYANA